MKHRVLALFAAVCLLFTGLPAFAQETTAAIQGTITDASGAALPGVTVEAVNEKGQRFTTVSDSSGNYRFPSVPPGRYTVTATLSGLEPATVRDLVVVLGTSPRVDLSLRMGAVAETLTVTAEAPVVDVTTSATATSIRAETFETLPKGRTFESIVTMAASARQDDRQGGISIDGATGLENRYVVDGLDTTDPLEGDVGKRVITDIIEEVQVKSAGYEAEFGGAMGGVINVITKTGRNDFAGSVRVDYRDRSWNGEERPQLLLALTGGGAEQFVPPEEDFTIVEPGISLGGPIMRDRLWFFGAYHPSIVNLERPVNFVSPGSFPAQQTFEQEQRQNNILLNVSGNFGSRVAFKVAGNRTGAEVENSALPARSGRGSANPASYTRIIDTGENDTISGYLDFIPSPMWLLSARGGHYRSNFSQEGVSNAERYLFELGSPRDFGVTTAPSVGFSNIPTNSATLFDEFTRDNLSLDVSAFPSIAGTHNIKAGVQFDNVSNKISSGNLAPFYRFRWNRSDPFGFGRGTYGIVAVYMFETTGDITSENTAVFVQDSWNLLNNRLTLNLGVRAEQERVPEYQTGEDAVKFDFADKTAPRFGFAYDVFNNGRSKLYGSWGKFYDIMKLDMPRGSFGGDKWVWHSFGLETLDWENIRCTNVSNAPNSRPNCSAGLTYLGSIDLRHPSIENIDPDLEPMQTQEFQLGWQQELGHNMAAGVRLVRKELLRAIEDLGTLCLTDTGALAECYTIGNPGFGLSTVGSAAVPGFPKATRTYDAAEFEFTRRMLRNWALHATYVYSRLRGNLPGLANADEAQFGNSRIDPNVGRWGDLVESLFDASGSRDPVEGPLPGDRPHQFKAQLSYSAPFGTTVGVNQYVGSGTPVSTQMLHHNVEFYPFGRGDLGRTPTLTQTDLLLQHRFSLGGRMGLEVFLNVLNVLDEDTELSYYQISNQGSVQLLNASGAAMTTAQCRALGRADCLLTAAEFFAGFDARAQQAALTREPRFQQPSSYQDPRSVRVGVRFEF